jgi:hypothetical protein
MRFFPFFIQAIDYEEDYSIMPGRPNIGDSDTMSQPGWNEPLGIKRSSPGSSENRTFPGSDPFVIRLRH